MSDHPETPETPKTPSPFGHAEGRSDPSLISEFIISRMTPEDRRTLYDNLQDPVLVSKLSETLRLSTKVDEIVGRRTEATLAKQQQPPQNFSPSPTKNKQPVAKP